MTGLSLKQAPPYNIPLFFYMLATFYLFLFSGAIAIYGVSVSDRYAHEAIAVTHLFTLGFLMNIIFGTLFQMMPVLMGEAYSNVVRRATILLLTFNGGIGCFIGYFLFDITACIFVSSALLGGSVLFFAFYSFATIGRTKEKNAVVRTFMGSFFFMIVGSALGVLALLQKDGFFGGYRFGDSHIVVMLFGVVFLLSCGVVFKIIPMFYVSKKFATIIQKGLHASVSLILLILIFFTLFEIEFWSVVFQTALALLIMGFGLYTVKLLKERKRARSDLSVNFFYFANFNLAIGGFVWILSIYFDLQLQFLLGAIFGIGFIYPLINGMLYKIIPFLTWFHLSSKSIFEAEMGAVLSAKMMKKQFYIFLMSYVALVFACFWQPFVVFFALLFLGSSFLLFFNILSGYRYHAALIKKALKNESN